jgi:hypothetical protein
VPGTFPTSAQHLLLAELGVAALLCLAGIGIILLSTRWSLGLRPVSPGDAAVRAFARRRRVQTVISAVGFLVGVALVIVTTAANRVTEPSPSALWAHAFVACFIMLGAVLLASSLCFRCPCCGAWQGVWPNDSLDSATFLRLRRMTCRHCNCVLDASEKPNNRRRQTD